MNKKPVSTLLNEIKTLAITGCRFASINYEAKGSGEVALHRVALGVSIEKAYKRDLALLVAKLPTLSGVDAVACGEIIESLKESLEKGIGKNSAYTCAGVYEPIARGIKLHIEKCELHVTGFSIGKTVLTEGSYKTVKSSEKTLAKKKLQKGMKSAKFRQFALSEIGTVKMNGKTISFE